MNEADAEAAFRLDKTAIRRSFDRAAASYELHDVLQRRVAAALDERLSCMRVSPGHVLDAGCGTGGLAALLGRRYPRAGMTLLDIAPAMLVRARGRGLAERWSRRRWRRLCGDLESLPLASASTDLLASSLALQWLNDPGRSFREVARVLRPGGLFAFATLGPDTLKELRAAFSEVDDTPHVSRFPDMHELGDALLGAGFEMPVMEMEYLRLTYADLGTMARDLKGLGAHNATGGRHRGLWGPRRWRRLEAAMERFRDGDGRLSVTWEVLYGHGWARQPVAIRVQDILRPGWEGTS